MAGAMAMLITGACMGLSGNIHEACSKSAEAGAKQSGLEQTVNGTADYITKKADRQAHELLGDTAMDIAGGGIFIVKTIQDKSVDFKLPTLGICDRITNKVGVDRYSLELVWVLP